MTAFQETLGLPDNSWLDKLLWKILQDCIIPDSAMSKSPTGDLGNKKIQAL